MNAAYDLQTPRQKWAEAMYRAGWRVGTDWDEGWDEFDWYHATVKLANGENITVSAEVVAMHWAMGTTPPPF